MKILIDTNILLDYLTKREPYYENAAKIMSMCADRSIQGCIAAHSVMNAFYILRKAYTSDERRKMLLYVCDIVSVVGIDAQKVTKALKNADFQDMEDCLQSECAAAFEADYIVTRNTKDFTGSSVKAVTPDELVKKL